MYLIGLTGGIASGKSTVSKIIQEDLGYEIIDGDLIARQVVEPGTRAHSKIKKIFGQSIFDPVTDSIDRNQLGEIIFKDSKLRKQLNSITHPEIYKSIFWRLVKALFSRSRLVVLDLPLLYESGYVVNMLDIIIVVYVPQDIQIERLIARNNLGAEDASNRIKSQMDLNEKCKRANFVIDNSGTKDATRSAVIDLFRTNKDQINHVSSRRYLILDTIVAVITACVSHFVLRIFGL